MIGELGFTPLVPWPVIAAAGLVAFLLLGIALIRRARGAGWRAMAMAVLLVALADPRMVAEKREPRRDIAVIVVDASASQEIGERPRRTAEALGKTREALSRFTDLETRLIEVGDHGEGTRLFRALEGAVAEIPRRQFAGAVLITDGQVHDVPEDFSLPGPVHVMLTGERDETDRRLTVERAPGYGMVGQSVTITFRVEDSPAADTPRTAVEVSLRRDGGEAQTVAATVGETRELEIDIDHAGPTTVELEVEGATGELSTRNNRAAIVVNGVRDRLRVLLVSGQPHGGERTWRNLLKSDPSVDLVHFTILRPPEKDDFTPVNELSLIVFPVRELFEVKLHEFDLVVFDRYVVRDVLPPSYFANIADYVRKGGALLLAVGPEFAGLRGLSETPLGRILPGKPSGQVLEGGFRPSLAEKGRRHPVTATLPGADGDGARWGRWFRHVETTPTNGVTLMEGRAGAPLLILDRVEAGRIALLASDHIWLWARGYEGGGPQAELLRRLAHWLMKEPELEEESLIARARGERLVIERRSLSPDNPPVTLTTPSGTTRKVPLEAAGGGRMRALVTADAPGLYRIEDGARHAIAAVGALNPVEMAAPRATAEPLATVAKASGGGIAWLADGMVELRRTRPDRDTSGRGWMGIRRNDAQEITGVTQTSLIPAIVLLALVLGGLTTAWWREGR
jgi:hypothetical protein